jgi:hypothetical protein
MYAAQPAVDAVASLFPATTSRPAAVIRNVCSCTSSNGAGAGTVYALGQ